MTEKGDIRKAFGQFGDVSVTMVEMFGDIYLDNPSPVRPLADGDGVEVGFTYETNDLIERAYGEAEPISSKECQELAIRHLDALTGKAGSLTWKEMWCWGKHTESCHNHLCLGLEDICNKDKYLTGEQIFETYGHEIERLIKESRNVLE